MDYGYSSHHQNIYMAAEFGFRFMDTYHREVFFNPQTMTFKAADILGKDSVGTHVIASGRTIETNEQLYIHRECYVRFAPEVGDTWQYMSVLSGNVEVYIANDNDLKTFIVKLQRKPDKYTLTKRKGMPHLTPQRITTYEN